MRKEISIILPTKNHEKKIFDTFEYVHEYLQNHYQKFEILVVSNGSSRQNINLIDDLEDVKHIVTDIPGKGNAVRLGMKASNYEHILICDSDFSVDIKFLDLFYKNNLPIGIFMTGSRRLKNSKVKASPQTRNLSGFVFNLLIKKILNLDISDTQCGFKLIDKTKFTDCDKFLSNNYIFDVELYLLALIQKIKIFEIPVTYIHNSDSTVNIFTDSLIMFKDIFKLKQIYKNKI